MEKLNVVSENMNSTVISKYEYDRSKAQSFQTEAKLEKEFIRTLVDQSYDYLNINSEAELVLNLKLQLEKLNNYEFSEKEWDYLFNSIIKNGNDGILEKTKKIQEDYIQTITLDDGTLKNIKFIDKEHIHNNRLQVINQYENSGNRDNRYDVTVLVNGFPMIHIELKRRGKPIREAFNQINRYQRDSFWAGSGLYEYIQIFVISNGTYTKYYSNTTRDLHVKGGTKKSSNTFEFTSYWADQENKAITDLIDFTKTFLAKRTILNILTKYCVFTSENNLLVMRPYQIVATEKIINRIEIAHNDKKRIGTINAGGYIWHTTGSGKTLTSFKTAQLATSLDYIDKVLFVVDRKDLDYQTMKEYDRFKKGAANANTSTAILKSQLEDDSKIIITTIQKLTSFIKKNPDHEVYNKQIVLIFDECHRGQFGDMHNLIVKKFKKYYMFGFTGTPIFAENSRTVKGISMTTGQLFGDRLHTYTIVHAINDKNVLPFRYEYVKTVDIKDNIKDEKVNAIDTEKVLMNPARINSITNYIIDNYSIKTKNTESYSHSTLYNVIEVAKNNRTEEVREKRYVNGFNSIFATASIPMAKMYYEAFKKRQEEHNLKIALIYSFGVNDEEYDSIDDENSESTENLSQTDRDFLDYAIRDYNEMFGTSYDSSSEKFQNYYKDVSLRMKNKEIDLLIVANMFLTGFDAKTLNTLWVDKNLKYHGLIQAFSRTNRILNSIKTFGNIVCFRDLEKELNEALGLFGDKNANNIVLLKTYEDYYYGYEGNEETKEKEFPGYQALVEVLKERFPVGKMIIGEQNQKEFVKLFGQILKVRNILSSFDKFQNDNLLTERELQDYQGEYLRIRDDFTIKEKTEKVDITDDVVFEMELVKQIEVNIDYILALIAKYHESNMQDKEIRVNINKAIMASPDLRNKKELIEAFIDSLDGASNVFRDFQDFMNSKKREELDKIIEEENLKKEETYKFVEDAFERGMVETEGPKISNLLPKMSRFSADGNRQVKKKNVIEKILDFFDRFYVLTNTLLNHDPVDYGNVSDEDETESLMVSEESEEYKSNNEEKKGGA